MVLATLSRLLPGDCVFSGNETATFITATAHPLPFYADRGLMLVVWKMGDRSISLDALMSFQEVGKVVISTSQERLDRLVEALFGDEPGWNPPGLP
jgi:hypothetical protein